MSAVSISADSVAPIAVARRSGYDESIHHGIGVVVAADGAVVSSLGDVRTAIYPRSALKPLQASAMVSLGLDLPAHLLALVCASHSGEPDHLARVIQILDRHALGVDDLENTKTLPLGAEANEMARRTGVEPSSLQQNCSGKHAGMLATCAVNGWPTTGYRDPLHPLQQAITDHLVRLGAAVDHVGVDGCGAPTHVVRLVDLARSIGTISGPDAPEAGIAAAMRLHPWMVGGTGRDVTVWMASIDGLVAKEGAAGVMVAGLADGSAAAVKVADGSDDTRRSVSVEMLRRLGVDVDAHEEARRVAHVAVLGHGEKVGEITPLPWP
ncbi:MAG: asparaginase [Actinomycetota bacterium]